MKVGDTTIMLFYLNGMTSEEEWEVIAIDEDIITLNTDEDEDKCRKFRLSDGACINDDSTFGAQRSLKI